jgi:cell shape-determining protein MreC
LADNVDDSYLIDQGANKGITGIDTGSLNAILIEQLIFVASITTRSLPFLLSALEL